MIHLIDKDVLVAEIEEWRDRIKKGIFSIPLTGSDRADATFEYEILGKVRDFLDTLEVKEVDLEKGFELTWEDVAWIVNKVVYCKIKSTSTSEDICKDVLNQFKAYKEE